MGKLDQNIQFGNYRAKLDLTKTLNKSGGIVAATQDNRHCTQVSDLLYEQIRMHRHEPNYVAIC
jgi:hypothetical protein